MTKAFNLGPQLKKVFKKPYHAWEEDIYLKVFQGTKAAI